MREDFEGLQTPQPTKQLLLRVPIQDSSCMDRISYLPDARDVEASPAETILDAALRAGIS